MAFRKRQKKINIKTFECSVMLVVTDKVHQAESLIHKKYKTSESPFEEGEADGITITVNFNLYIIILDINSVSYNLVGHEVCHVVNRITKDREINDEETMAWLTGYLCEEVHTFINKIKYDKPKRPIDFKNVSGCDNRPDSPGGARN